MSLTGTVYLLHFSEPYKHARHYLGFTDRGDIDRRIQQHQRGRGATLTRVAVQNGISLELVRTWPNETRGFERSLKNKKNTGRLCPKCTEKK